MLRFDSTDKQTTSYMTSETSTSDYNSNNQEYAYSLTILKGLQFLHVNNSMYAFLSKPQDTFSSNEVKIYRTIASSLSKQIETYMEDDLKKDYILNVTINQMVFK